LALHVRLFHDAATVAFLALLLVPFYLLLNQYWKSLVLLLALYGIVGLLFLRLGWYMRRAMRRLPAEIPPWQPLPRAASGAAITKVLFGDSEALYSVRKDPLYLQEVLKPRLRQLLAYRLSGSVDVPFDALEQTLLQGVDPALLDFLGRREATGIWAKYLYRQRRLHDVLNALRHLEAV
jgi:hypothetical protein